MTTCWWAAPMETHICPFHGDSVFLCPTNPETPPKAAPMGEASVPWIVAALDADARAIRNAEPYRWIFRNHDGAYELGGSEFDRLRADIAMVINMDRSEIHPDYCVAFFNAVRRYGASHWHYPPTIERGETEAP